MWVRSSVRMCIRTIDHIYVRSYDPLARRLSVHGSEKERLNQRVRRFACGPVLQNSSKMNAYGQGQAITDAAVSKLIADHLQAAGLRVVPAGGKLSGVTVQARPNGTTVEQPLLSVTSTFPGLEGGRIKRLNAFLDGAGRLGGVLTGDGRRVDLPQEAIDAATDAMFASAKTPMERSTTLRQEGGLSL